MFKLTIETIKKYITGNGENEPNINQFMKKKQNIIGICILSVMVIVIIILHSLAKTPPKRIDHTPKNMPVMGGVITSDFTQKNELSELEKQQEEMDKLTNKLLKLKKETHINTSKQDQSKQELIQKINEIMAKKEALNKQTSHPTTQKAGTIEPHDMPLDTHAQDTPVRTQLETINFTYHHSENSYHIPNKVIIHGKTANNYVPAGTFARGVLLEGADANASVNGQSDTTPILVRILDRGTLPNGHHSQLRGCFVLASMYGDISSERGEARLTKISCTRKNGQILEKKVQGYLSFHGKEGIRGEPVMRNGKILEMAGISGLLSGFGSALQQSTTTQSISPLGQTDTIDSNKVLQGGLYGGVSTAMGQLASYYIKRADQYHPVISIGSGTVATVIFQAGFSLKDDDKSNTRTQENTESQPKQSTTQEIKSLLKQAQKMSKNNTSSPFSNVN